MEVVIIGSSHAGIAATKRIKKLYPTVDVILFDRKETDLSYIGSGAHLFLNNEIASLHSTEYTSNDDIYNLGAGLKLAHNVVRVDTQAQVVHARDLKTGKLVEQHYDKLIYAAGSYPHIPPIEGVDNDRVTVMKTLDDADRLKQNVGNDKEVLVVGGGLLGLEVAMSLQNQGHQVTILQSGASLASHYFDLSIASRLAQLYRDHGVKVELGQLADSIVATADDRVQITTAQGGRYVGDQVVVSAGVRPNTTLLRDKVDMDDKGEISVDRFMYTSDHKIMAVGDSTDSYFTPTGTDEYITQVSGAIREGNIAGMNVFEKWVQTPGSQATYGLQLFDWLFFRTGATERNLLAQGLPVASTEVTQKIRPDWVDEDSHVTLKLVYNLNTQVVLGAQLISNRDIHDVITTFSLLINRGITLTELAFGDVFFEPHFNNPINLINNVALTAIDQINASNPVNNRT